jgi:hypothetical protein
MRSPQYEGQASPGGYHRGVPYLLALVALAAPIVLVVQAVRGRVRVTSCCSVPADQDARLRIGSEVPSADRA